jgi:hypothetical protein
MEAPRKGITMKTAKKPAAKTSAAKTLAARTPTSAASWLELAAIEMALRTGTVLMICAAAALVLIHLNVYFAGLPSPDQIAVGPSSACFLRGC